MAGHQAAGCLSSELIIPKQLPRLLALDQQKSSSPPPQKKKKKKNTQKDLPLPNSRKHLERSHRKRSNVLQNQTKDLKSFI